MYSPSLSKKATRTVYRLKQAWKKPMTEIIDSLIRQSLRAIDKESVCGVCNAEQNNDCNDCYLNGKEAFNVEQAK